MKNIYIIDTVNTAMAVSLIIQQEKTGDSIIYERKIGINEHVDVETLAKTIFPNISDIPSETVAVPNHYFLGSKINRFRRLCLLKKYRENILKDLTLGSNNTFIGSRTSSLMTALVKSPRIFIEHGFGDYAQKSRNIKNLFPRPDRWLRSQIKTAFGVAHSDFAFSEKAYTLCNIGSKTDHHLDYSEVRVAEKIQKTFKAFSRYIPASKVTLLLAAGERHSFCGLPSYSGKFDHVNVELVKKHIDPCEFVMIKFHQSLYTAGNHPNSSILDSLKNYGYNCVIFDNMLPDDLVGQIPAEIIVKYFPVNKIVSECSSVVFNVATKPEIQTVCDLSCSPYYKTENQSFYNMVRAINTHLKNSVRIYY